MVLSDLVAERNRGINAGFRCVGALDRALGARLITTILVEIQSQVVKCLLGRKLELSLVHILGTSLPPAILQR